MCNTIRSLGLTPAAAKPRATSQTATLNAEKVQCLLPSISTTLLGHRRTDSSNKLTKDMVSLVPKGSSGCFQDLRPAAFFRVSRNNPDPSDNCELSVSGFL